MLKRIFSSGLLGIILLCSVGHFPVFWVKRNNVRSAIKQRIKNSIPEDELHLIIFNSEDDIPWTRSGKEFKMGDRMYDVVHKVRSEGKVRYLCVNDIEEEVLFADLSDRVDKTLGGDKAPLKSKGKLMLKLVSYFDKWEDVEVIFASETSEDKEHREIPQFFDGLTQNVPSPPPQLAA